MRSGRALRVVMLLAIAAAFGVAACGHRNDDVAHPPGPTPTPSASPSGTPPQGEPPNVTVGLTCTGGSCNIMGTAGMRVSQNGVVVGTDQVPNVILQPGENQFWLLDGYGTVVLNQPALAEASFSPDSGGTWVNGAGGVMFTDTVMEGLLAVPVMVDHFIP